MAEYVSVPPLDKQNNLPGRLHSRGSPPVHHQLKRKRVRTSKSTATPSEEAQVHHEKPIPLYIEEREELHRGTKNKNVNSPCAIMRAQILVLFQGVETWRRNCRTYKIMIMSETSFLRNIV